MLRVGNLELFEMVVIYNHQNKRLESSSNCPARPTLLFD